jgi:hypothetical protein
MAEPDQIGFCKNTQCERLDIDVPVRAGRSSSCSACGGGLYLRPVGPTLRIVAHCPVLPPCGRGGEDHIEQIVAGRGFPHLKISCPGREPTEVPLANYLGSTGPEGGSTSGIARFVGDDLAGFSDDDLRLVAIPLEPCKSCDSARNLHSVVVAAPRLNPRSGSSEVCKEVRCPEQVAKSRFRV